MAKSSNVDWSITWNKAPRTCNVPKKKSQIRVQVANVVGFGCFAIAWVNVTCRKKITAVGVVWCRQSKWLWLHNYHIKPFKKISPRILQVYTPILTRTVVPTVSSWKMCQISSMRPPPKSPFPPPPPPLPAVTPVTLVADGTYGTPRGADIWDTEGLDVLKMSICVSKFVL